jgi:hypothetical protein
LKTRKRTKTRTKEKKSFGSGLIDVRDKKKEGRNEEREMKIAVTRSGEKRRGERETHHKSRSHEFMPRGPVRVQAPTKLILALDSCSRRPQFSG